MILLIQLSKIKYIRPLSILLIMVFSYSIGTAQYINIDVSTTPSCHENGSLTFNISGGYAPYNITIYSTGAAVDTISNTFRTNYTIKGLADGSYFIYVSDSSGQYGYGYTNVDAQFNVSTDITPAGCKENGSLSATATGGTAPYSYLWSNGATTQTVNNVPEGDYRLIVTDANGCQNHQSDSIYVYKKSPINLSLSTTPESCKVKGTANVIASGGTEPYTYQWSTYPVQNSDTAKNLTSGYYSVIVTDTNGCSNEAWAYVPSDSNSLNLTISTTSESCMNKGTASIIASGGMAPYTYHWNTNPIQTSDTAKNLTSGYYNVLVTDSNGCSNETWVYIPTDSNSLSLSINTTPESCMAKGTANIIATGGIAPYTFSWIYRDSTFQSSDDSSSFIGNLKEGIYFLTVTDLNGCGKMDSLYVQNTSSLNISSYIQPQSCDSLGSVWVNASGGIAPYTFSWNYRDSLYQSSGDSSTFVGNLKEGIYFVTVTDSHGCGKTDSIYVPNTSSINISSYIQPQSCDSLGSVWVNASGGIAPYTFSWNYRDSLYQSSDDSSSFVSNLKEGVYFVTVTDSHGCGKTDSIYVPNTSSINISSFIQPQSCDSLGSVLVNASGGIAPYTFSWNYRDSLYQSSGDSSSFVSNLKEGIYFVTVTDSHGCGKTDSIYVPNTSSINISSFIQPQSCDSLGSVWVNASGGIAPYTFSWNYRDSLYQSSGDSSTFVGNLKEGIYFVTVTDSHGCEKMDSIYVPNTSLMNISTSIRNKSCNTLGSANIIVTGGTAPYSYSWSNGATTDTVINLQEGFYDVLVTDANNCQTHDSIIIYNISSIIVTDSITSVSCNSPGSATVFPRGGTAPYSYLWNDIIGQTNATANGLDEGVYKVTISDAAGCSTDHYVYVWADSSLSLTTSFTNATCNQADGSATVKVINGTAPYTYFWDNGQITSTATGLQRGWHNVLVIDAKRCAATDTVFIDSKNPIHVTFNNTYPTCGANDGSITAIVTGGKAPYSYKWNIGNTTSTISGLSSDVYSVTVQDASGCVSNEYTYLDDTTNCYVIISGTVYNDLNGNCIKDIGENGIGGAIIKYTDLYYYVTDSDGKYYLYAYPGTYQVNASAPYNYENNCGESSKSITVNATTPGSTYSNIDFGYKAPNPIYDLDINISCGNPRPGFTRNALITYINKGNVSAVGKIEYTFSGQWDYSHAYPTPDKYDPTTKKAEWNYNVLAGDYGFINVYMKVGTDVTLGTKVSCKANISTTETEIDLSNNFSECTTPVVNSYDPNDMQVFPNDDSHGGYISDVDTLITYLIRFQNTGSDTAYNVVVKDTLDANLIKDSIQSVISSHKCKVSVKDNVLEFNFMDINLLDSTFNEAKSHGFVSYQIRRKKRMAGGESIFNKSDIYFDYNVPVATNRVQSKLAIGAGIATKEDSENQISAYPVPFNDRLTLSFKKEVSNQAIIKMISTNGEVLGVVTEDNLSISKDAIDLNLSNLKLNPGLYILQVIDRDKVYNCKVVKGNN